MKFLFFSIDWVNSIERLWQCWRSRCTFCQYSKCISWWITQVFKRRERKRNNSIGKENSRLDQFIHSLKKTRCSRIFSLKSILHYLSLHRLLVFYSVVWHCLSSLFIVNVTPLIIFSSVIRVLQWYSIRSLLSLVRSTVFAKIGRWMLPIVNYEPIVSMLPLLQHAIRNLCMRLVDYFQLFSTNTNFF